jgi:hypothetical protein
LYFSYSDLTRTIAATAKWTLCLLGLVFVLLNTMALAQGIYLLLQFAMTEFAPTPWLSLIR